MEYRKKFPAKIFIGEQVRIGLKNCVYIAVFFMYTIF